MSTDVTEPLQSTPTTAEGSATAGTIAERIAAWASAVEYDSIPAEVVDYAKLLVADTMGVSVAGIGSDAARSARSAVLEMNGGAAAGPATIIGTDDRASTRDAALVNGIVMDLVGMDDTHVEGACHPSAVVLPAVLSIGQAISASGRDILTAYIVGVEVQARIASASKVGFLQNGFATSTVAGSFGAAVAVGRLLELSSKELTAAQGFVGGLAAGSMQFGGSGAWTKSVNKGWPALCGINAAYFARNGYLAPSDIYEGRFGTFANYIKSGHPVDMDRCTRDMGVTWEILDVISKRYPVCHFIDSALQAVTKLRDDVQIEVGEIDSIVCRVPLGTVGTICEPESILRHPVSAYAASSSVYFNVALALIGGTVTIDLQADHVNDADVLRLADRVSYELLEDTRFPEVFECEVIITMRDGTQHELRERSGRLSPTEFEAKFTEQTAEIMGATRSQEAWSAVSGIDTLSSVDTLLSVFTVS